MSSIERFANPTRFLRLQAAVQPWVWGITIALFAAGLYLGLAASPTDYQQGETVRIMYVHVPAAWSALMVYTVMALASIVAIVFRHPLADVAARAAAPIGACFCFLSLATGSLWGKPMWGTWWVWDARLTSVFVLFLMYLGVIALQRAMDDPVKAARPVAILVLIGMVNIPISNFSVEWWNTPHQPAAVIRMDGPTIHPSLLWPLLVMAIGFTALFFFMHMVAMRTEIWRRRIATMRRASAQERRAAANPVLAE